MFTHAALDDLKPLTHAALHDHSASDSHNGYHDVVARGLRDNNTATRRESNVPFTVLRRGPIRVRVGIGVRVRVRVRVQNAVRRFYDEVTYRLYR